MPHIPPDLVAPSPAYNTASAPRVVYAPEPVRRIVAQGRWIVQAFSAPRDWKTLAGLLAALPSDPVLAWDLRPIEQLDHIGAQLLWNHWQHRWPAQLEASPRQRALLEQVAEFTIAPPPAPAPTLADIFKRLASHGPWLLEVGKRSVQMLGQLVLDIGTLLRAPQRGPWRDFSGQLYHGGATALPITALVGLLIGIVLAYLTSQQLRLYGAETFIVNILGLALIRELGPVLAAVLIAGRSGSSITAQIGVMRVTDELDAMRVMGIAHGFRLVMPRVLAMAISMPLISMWTTAAALLGGMLAARAALDISPAYFLQTLPRVVPILNVWLALGKSAVFGMLIAMIACYQGLHVKPNTESLGHGTTASVVTSITMVILVDALFAILFKGMGFR